MVRSIYVNSNLNSITYSLCDFGKLPNLSASVLIYKIRIMIVFNLQKDKKRAISLKLRMASSE
jgi:hypothetical protein